jgi:hypothetical protein
MDTIAEVLEHHVFVNNRGAHDETRIQLFEKGTIAFMGRFLEWMQMRILKLQRIIQDAMNQEKAEEEIIEIHLLKASQSTGKQGTSGTKCMT